MSICTRCAATFTCGMTDAPNDNAACWCTSLPPLPRDAYNEDEGTCLCPQCLRSLIEETARQAPRS
ncbi:cysteine-rich CWC family protein [Noviherbaspirillum sp.]|uniref:cysteine-rich CWC family protein n=1 Tax=Noviherbaspirillum sp. TaxID=1926288 RepID=UPI002FE34F49